MHFKFAVLVSSVVLLICQSARAGWDYDAVDALLAPGPIGAVGEALSSPSSNEAEGIDPIGQTSAGLAVPESAPYSVRTPLSATIHEPAPDVGVDGSDASATAEQKSRAPWRVDSVPEPSALAMATVALIFFLLFGRRRRLA